MSTASYSYAVEWKGIFVSGDNSIENFDNAREDLTQALSSMGRLDTLQFSSSKNYISEENLIYPATKQNISAGFSQLSLREGEGCLVHMTSHGGFRRGFYMVLEPSQFMTPRELISMVDSACGQAPTVILISACYSGQFIKENIKGPNRVILTAAKEDLPSFGCSPDTEYTYWDGCLLENISSAKSWPDLYEKVKVCISAKESKLGVKPSEPQAFFGENTLSWPLIH